MHSLGEIKMYNYHYRKILLFIFTVFFLANARAALHLELTQGINAALPISIVPFSNQPNTVAGNTTLTNIIGNDLQNSGEFNVKMSSLLDPSSWRKQGINDVVTGQVRLVGSGKYEVSFQLQDASSPIANTKNAVPNPLLLSQTFQTTQAGLRPLAHHISDMIYEKLIGVRGVFSTKIAYVLAHSYSNNTAQYELIVADQDGF